MTKKHQEYLADFSLITISLIWGSTFIIIKQTLDSFEPITFLFLRFLVASIAMLVLIAPLYKKIDKTLLTDGTILGTVLFIVFLFQTIALKLSTATEVGFLTGLYVLFVPILSAVFLKIYPHVFSWIGVFFSATGMILITYQADTSISLGQLFAVVNAFFIGVHILTTDRYSRKHNVLLLTAIQIIIVCILSGLYSVMFETADYSKVLEPYIGFSILGTGLIATVLCFFLQTAMQKHTTPTKASIMFTLEPISSAFFGFFIAAEIMNKKQYFGAALIISAILIAEAGTALKNAKKNAQRV
ncbi:MAG: hypothetical protein C0603_00945 [Denitrovibrio sp.]|nr:MAG: hypothetical protein C0603_00945 [Denitrovibrio sp.]